MRSPIRLVFDQKNIEMDVGEGNIFVDSLGRIKTNETRTSRFKAVYNSNTLQKDIVVAINNTVPDPLFTLDWTAGIWDGVRPVTLAPNIINHQEMTMAGFGTLTYAWNISSKYFFSTRTDSTFELISADSSGDRSITLCLSNGGDSLCKTIYFTTTVRVFQ